MWQMRPLTGGFEPNDEVDELRWLAPSAAIPLLDYERDRDLLRGLGRTSVQTDPDYFQPGACGPMR